jgi:hypothetical protein
LDGWLDRQALKGTAEVTIPAPAGGHAGRGEEGWMSIRKLSCGPPATEVRGSFSHFYKSAEAQLCARPCPQHGGGGAVTS